jgi:hypothetical protein
MKIVLVHGFNVRDGGQRTVDRLAPYLVKAGHTVDKDNADYGFFSLWMVRLKKHSAVLRIAKAIENADAVISHSNGSNYTNKALRQLEWHQKTYRVVRLSPALNSGGRVPSNISKGWVFHTRSDFWVWMSGLIPWHPWGRMGQKGYKGDDSRLVNRDFTDLIKRHSDWFTDDNVEFIAKEIILVLE